mgnify:CR=1 FL=1
MYMDRIVLALGGHLQIGYYHFFKERVNCFVAAFDDGTCAKAKGICLALAEAACPIMGGPLPRMAMPIGGDAFC